MRQFKLRNFAVILFFFLPLSYSVIQQKPPSSQSAPESTVAVKRYKVAVDGVKGARRPFLTITYVPTGVLHLAEHVADLTALPTKVVVFRHEQQ